MEGAWRKPQTVGGAVYLLMAASVLSGLAVVVLGPWRTGTLVMGVGLVLGGGMRLVLPDRQAGMLRVRRKGTDVALMVLVGIALVVLSFVVPDQRR